MCPWLIYAQYYSAGSHPFAIEVQDNPLPFWNVTESRAELTRTRLAPVFPLFLLRHLESEQTSWKKAGATIQHEKSHCGSLRFSKSPFWVSAILFPFARDFGICARVAVATSVRRISRIQVRHQRSAFSSGLDAECQT